MQKEKLVPAIRFSGYHTEWNLKTLEQIAKITFGQSPLSIYYSDKKTDHILVQGNADVKNRWVYPRIYTSQITKTAFVGDIIFSVRAPVGSVAKTNYDIVIGRGVAAIKGDNFIYFNLLWKEISRFWESKSSGSTFDSITSLELAQSEITIPSDLSEQQKIGQLFSNLDSLIGSQVLKLEKLQTIKQSLLNNMFASYGQKIPEIRFKGFEKKWEKKLIGDIILSIPYKKYINVPSIGGIFPVIQQGNDPISGFANGSPFMNYKNVMIFGDHTLSIYKSNSPFFLASDGVRILQSRNNVPLEFLYRIVEKYLPMSHGYTRHYSILKRQEITMPLCRDEQQKIGQFFSSLDSLIHSQEQKLEKLNKIKQALLEKMFC
ncbi:restriction endonuclease subunit S [Mycoplasma sp. SH20]|uniref:restriction endonuclease subunit S n=1 Tax=Mycoplasma sp. SH20 TaxID=3401672 RepID=UPI003AAF88C2